MHRGVHLGERLGLNVGEAAQHTVAAAHTVDQVVLVKAGEHGELGVHGTRGALLEFVKGDSDEQLLSDAACLKNWIEEAGQA